MIIDINKTYRTEAGYETCIYRTDGGGYYPVHGAVLVDGEWKVQTWTETGASWTGGPSGFDLVEVKPKRVAYINVYPKGLGDVAHPDRASADGYAMPDRVARVRVEYEEGQFDE